MSYCIDANDVHYNPITFYVYHSSDCTVEKFTIPQGQAFDLTSLVKEGYFYGGYFSGYGGAVNYDIDNPQEGKIEGDLTYDGSSIYYRDENDKIVRWFTKANAYTENGSVLMPKDNSTYFMRELPKEYTMKQYNQYVYNTNTNQITDLYNVYTIDNTFYETYSANIITSDNISSFRCTSVSSITIGNTKITPETITGRSGGYVVYYNFTRDKLPGTNSVFIIENTLTTYDGIDIHSYVKVFTNDWTKDNIAKENSDTMPTLD